MNDSLQDQTVLDDILQVVSAEKIWSQKQYQKMKTVLYPKEQMHKLPEGIKRKISLGNMKMQIMECMMIVIQTILLKMMKPTLF